MLPSDDQLALRDVAQRFSREKLRPDYQARDTQDRVDRALMREMGGLGLIGVDLPEEFGGLGQNGVTAGMIIEDIAYGDFNISYVQLLASLMGLIMVRNADPDLARHWVQGLTSGRLLMGLGLTEPRGGSDAANLALKARKDGSAYVLNGEKASISFSEQADSMVLFARTGDADEGPRGVSAFLVPLDLPGIQRSRYNDVGSRIVGRGSVFFDDVRVPAEYRLGAEGTGFTQVMKGFEVISWFGVMLPAGTPREAFDRIVASLTVRPMMARRCGVYVAVKARTAPGCCAASAHASTRSLARSSATGDRSARKARSTCSSSSIAGHCSRLRAITWSRFTVAV